MIYIRNIRNRVSKLINELRTVLLTLSYIYNKMKIIMFIF